MNRTETIRGDAKRNRMDSEIDSILSAEDELIPSSGFLASVMERVEEQAAAPPPIPFPWKRALPGILTATGVFGWGGYEMIRLVFLLPYASAAKSTIPLTIHDYAAIVGSFNQAEWIVIMLGASLLSWLLARRLAGHGGLL
jgi:hypothetical protein